MVESTLSFVNQYALYLAGLIAAIGAGVGLAVMRRRKRGTMGHATTIDPRDPFLPGPSLDDPNEPSALEQRIDAADTFLAFEQSEKAKNELEAALRIDPGSLEALIRLARIAEKTDRGELGRVAGVIGDATFKSGPYWEEAERLLGAGAKGAEESSHAAKAPLRVEPLDFDAFDKDVAGMNLETSLMDLVSSLPVPVPEAQGKSDRVEKAGEMAPMPMEFNLDFPTSAVEPKRPMEPAAPPAISNEISFDLPSLDLPDQALSRDPVPLPEPMKMEGLSFDLSLPDDNPATPLASSAESVSFDSLGSEEQAAPGGEGELDTMLELAKAYLDMGDSAGAKELLVEIAAKGSPELSAKAKGMLAGI